MEPKVIQVNEQDEEMGLMPKMEAHKKGVLHRAVSVFLFTTDGKWLLQRRAAHKYHSGGLWSNTACSHPLPLEDAKIAAQRRLKEEMGIEANVEKLFNFKYKVNLDNGLIEHELDHIFIARTDVPPIINTEEVEDWKYATIEEIQKEIMLNGSQYTEWFKLMFMDVHRKLENPNKFEL